MKEEPCLVCEERQAIPVYVLRQDPYLRRLGLRGQQVQKVMCRGCGLVYSKPQLEPVELKRLYETLRESSHPSKEHLWWKRKMGEGDFQWVAPHLPAAGRVLDIGCSEGSFLMQFKQAGWVTCGVEPSDYAQYGQKVYGLDIRQGAFEETELPQRAFDLVTALRVLEHLSDPKVFLERVKTLLKPDGFLYLEVPDAFKPRHHLAHFLGAEHLRLFTQGSLTRFLKQSGFNPWVVDGENQGLRVLARMSSSGVLNGASGPVPDSRDFFSEAKVLRRILRGYRLHYFLNSTLKSKARKSLDHWVGVRNARAMVDFGKRWVGSS